MGIYEEKSKVKPPRCKDVGCFAEAAERIFARNELNSLLRDSLAKERRTER